MNRKLGKILLVAALAAAISGCGASSHVLVGSERPPIDPDTVKVYLQAPAGAEQVAVLEASSRGSGPTNQAKTNKVIKRLKSEAAELGANGILLQGMGSEYAGSVGTMNSFANGGAVVGSGFSAPVMNKQGSAIAIYVPDQAQAGSQNAAPSLNQPPPSSEAKADGSQQAAQPANCESCKKIGDTFKTP